MKATPKNNRRYYLHWKIRKQGFKLKTNVKTIYLNLETQGMSKQVEALKTEFNYTIQTQLI